MLIGICGGVCAGKHSVLHYLVQKHHFEVLTIDRDDDAPSSSAAPSAVAETLASDANSISPGNDDNHNKHAKKQQPATGKSFANVAALLDYVTAHWQQDFVTRSIHNEAVVDALARRPFFILIHVDAPISVRWQRFRARCTLDSDSAISLETFVLQDDARVYGGRSSPGFSSSLSSGGGSGGAKPNNNNLVALAAHAQIKLLNASSSLAQLWQRLDALALTDVRRLRPTWDMYFMTLASLAARRSNCMRRQVGCVLVRERRVMSTGYNGTPRHIRNCNEGGCPRCNNASSVQGGGAALSTCLCLHAEENALLEAGRERIGAGATLYCNTCPCLTCTVKIVQVGITEVVYSQSYHMDAASARIFAEAGVKMRQFSPPREGLVDLIEDGGGGGAFDGDDGASGE